MISFREGLQESMRAVAQQLLRIKADGLLQLWLSGMCLGRPQKVGKMPLFKKTTDGLAFMD